MVKFNDDIPETLFPTNEVMETKRVTGISLLSDEVEMETNKKNTEKKHKVKNVYININSLNTYQDSEPKVDNETLLETVPNSTQKPSHKSSHKKSESKGKLREVHAYQDPTRSDITKRKLHSRIVKMVVGGGPTKTRVISYPDNSEYLKICAQK